MIKTAITFFAMVYFCAIPSMAQQDEEPSTKPETNTEKNPDHTHEDDTEHRLKY
jgi:hypothetical protein